MAIKIRCSECSKKISIDEAFAGGACRCPYCKAIVMVPGEGNQAAPARPAAPRPDSPDAPAAPAAPPVAPEDVPMADPVRIQSMAAMVVIGLLLVVLMAGAFFAFRQLSGGSDKTNNAAPVVSNEAPVIKRDIANPFQAKVEGACIASDIKIAAPVVYVIDCGARMQQMINLSAKIVGVSVRTLKPEEKFTVLMALSEDIPDRRPADGPKLPSGLVMMDKEFLPGGGDAEAKAMKFMTDLEEVDCCGHGMVSVTPAIKAALDMNPKTVVVFTNKEVEGVDELVAAAQKSGTKVVTLGMETGDAEIESLQKLSDGSKSETRAFTRIQLQAWSEQHKNE